jgi:hypothetical protein
MCPAREGDTKEGIGVLVLTRKEREEIAIGDDITVVVVFLFCIAFVSFLAERTMPLLTPRKLSETMI